MRTRLGICSMGLALAAGCGGGGDAMNKQLAELRAEVVKVRADNAVLSDRLDALELARDGYRGGARPAPAAPSPAAHDADATSDRPELEVVRLAPEGDGARPVIRSTASGVVVDDAKGARPEGATPPSTPRRTR